ncbi:hypothetical protein [Rothia sp. 11254D007CT]
MDTGSLNDNKNHVKQNDIHKSDSVSTDDIIHYILELGPAVGALQKSIKNPEIKYVLDLTSSQAKDIANGAVKLTKNKNGQIFAQYSNKGRFGSKIPIRQEKVDGILNGPDLFNQMQYQAVLQEIENIKDLLANILLTNQRILVSLHDDRSARIEMGKFSLREAESLLGGGLKYQLMANGLAELGLGISQLQKEISRNVEFLVEKEYLEVKGKKTQVINQKMGEIRTSLILVHAAYSEKFHLYGNLGESDAQLEVISQYSKFLNNEIIPYSTILSELDPDIHLFADSPWFNLAGKMKSVECFNSQLDGEKTVYIRAVEQ